LSGNPHHSDIIVIAQPDKDSTSMARVIYVMLVDLDQRWLIAAGRRYGIIELSSDRASIDETENIGSKP
jgi:hypothetical protein